MPNRFTEQLLSINTDPLGYIFWYDIRAILKNLQSINSNVAPSLFLYTDNNYIENKQTFICLLAAMSNEDIDELIIKWKE